MALIYAEFLFAGSRVSSISGSAKGTYRFSYTRQLLKSQEDVIEPTAVDTRAQSFDESTALVMLLYLNE